MIDVLLAVVAVIAIFIFGIYFGWKLREEHATRYVNALLQDVEKEQETKTLPIYIEKINDVFYVYSTDNEFISQANSIEAVEAALKQKYPGYRFIISEENLKEIGLIS